MSELPTIPAPPEALTEPYPPVFEPAPALPAWVRDVFLKETSALHNPDHAHLKHARLAFLWTNVDYAKKGKRVLGEARLGEPSGSNAWMVGRQALQLEQWFGHVPDFLITLDAAYASRQLEDEPAAVLALLEHELYHCVQDTDSSGMPAFDRKTGRPKWTIAPHDIEEFHGVARRYGAVTPAMQAFAAALEEGPTVAPAAVQGVCGSCGREIA